MPSKPTAALAPPAIRRFAWMECALCVLFSGFSHLPSCLWHAPLLLHLGGVWFFSLLCSIPFPVLNYWKPQLRPLCSAWSPASGLWSDCPRGARRVGAWELTALRVQCPLTGAAAAGLRPVSQSFLDTGWPSRHFSVVGSRSWVHTCQLLFWNNFKLTEELQEGDQERCLMPCIHITNSSYLPCLLYCSLSLSVSAYIIVSETFEKRLYKSLPRPLSTSVYVSSWYNPSICSPASNCVTCPRDIFRSCIFPNPGSILNIILWNL